MRIVCISSSQVPSDTANSIQVMKVCQAFTQLGHDVILLVPGPRPEDLESTALQEHYGLRTLFNIEWLPVRARIFGLIFDLIGINSDKLYALVKAKHGTHWMLAGDNKFNGKWRLYYQAYFDKYQSA